MPFIQFLLRRGTALEWTNANPVLAEGEVGLEKDTMKFKVGDGSNEWNDLAYAPQGDPGKDVLMQASETHIQWQNDGDVGWQNLVALADLQGPAGSLNDTPGSVTGDIIRWDEEDGAWEVVSEPLEFNQIILTPAETAALNQEGSLFYCSTDKAVHVCTSDA